MARSRASSIGTFAGMRDLRKRLEGFPSVSIAIAARVAPMLSQLAQQAFDAGVSPFGDSFGASSVTGETLDLVEGGALRARAVAYTASGRTIRASVGAVRHARYQLKHGFLPRRLPAAWELRVRAIAEDEIAKHLAGVG